MLSPCILQRSILRQSGCKSRNNWIGSALRLIVPILMLASPAWGQDQDGDGWSAADGDCCEVPSPTCPSPVLINPGAYDIPGNGVDDDCDGTVDNATSLNCAPDINLDPTGWALARALELCQTTTSAPPLSERIWGVIEAEILRADGTPQVNSLQVAVKSDFGPGVPALWHDTMAVLSSGTARDLSDPGYVAPFPGYTDSVNVADAPEVFTAAHGGALFAMPGCPTAGPLVRDSVQLRLRIRVPTNAIGFRFDYNFYASEYPEQCSLYNDHFLALLESGASGIPADLNVAFDANAYPVTAQSASFLDCEGCLNGSMALVSSGYDPLNDGATSWMPVIAHVLRGEEVTLAFHIWDAEDEYADSTVLLDGFHWIFDEVTGASPNTPGPQTILHPIHPNPFNPRTQIAYQIGRTGSVELDIYDLRGRRVRALVRGRQDVGRHVTIWDGKDDDGRHAAGGVYVVRLWTPTQTDQQKIALIR